jgi:exodeoxyribonuclease X
MLLDTETTDTDAPDVIQLAYTPLIDSPLSDVKGAMQLRFKPTKPISLGAMATHHIIAKDLENCPLWPGAWAPPEDCEYIIGHSVDFDWKAIGKPNVKRICTLALARKAWPGLDSHKLSALMYHIYPHPMAREFVRGAHDAVVDVDLLARLLFVLVDAFGRPATWEKLWEISEDARVPTHMTFGSKYSPYQFPPLGLPIPEMRKRDPSYVAWLLKNADIVKECPYWQKALTA